MYFFNSTVTVNIVDPEGKKHTIEAQPGKSILDVAHDNKIDLEGACEASLACSTCHVYVDEKDFGKLKEPSEQEEDMLDLAYGVSQLYARAPFNCYY